MKINTGSAIRKQAQAQLTDDLEKDIAALERYEKGWETATDETKFFNDTMGKASKTAQDFTGRIKENTGTSASFATAQKSAAVSTESIGMASKAAAFGVKALNVAMNIGVMLAVSIAIQAVVKGISHLVHAQEEAIATAKQLSSAYQTNVDSAMSNVSTLEKLQSKYNELSKGVDKYGNNVALSAEEYKEYKSIVEQIVGISPSLQTGYDNEGKAIANNNGLIEKSIDLQKQKIKAEQLGIISNEKLWTSAQGAISEYYQTLKSVNKIKGGFGEVLVENLPSGFTESSEQYKKFIKTFNIDTSNVDKTGLGSFKDYISALLADSGNLSKVVDKLKSNPNELSNFVNPDKLDEAKTSLDEYIQSLSGLETKDKAFNSTLQIIPQTIDAYDSLNDVQKNFITDYINGFSKLDVDTEEKVLNVKQNILNLTNTIANDSSVKTAITELFSLNEDTLSAEEYKDKVNAFITQIAQMLNMDENKLKVQLGFDIDIGQIQTMLDTLKGKLSGSGDTLSYLKTLSLDDLKIAYKIVNDSSDGMTLVELKKQIQGVQEATDNASVLAKLETSMYALSESTKKVSDGYEDFKTITDVVNGKLYLNDSQISDLCSAYPDLANKIKYTTSGWTLESGAIDVVNTAISGLSSAYVSAQQTITQIVSSGVQANLLQYGIELDAISSLADALHALTSHLAETKRDMASQTELGIPHMNMETPEEIEAGKIAVAWGAAKDTIKDAQEQVKKSVGLSKTPSSTSSKSPSSSSKAPIDDAFKNAEAELTHRKAMGDFTSDNLDTQILLNGQYSKAVENLKKYAKSKEDIKKVDEMIYSSATAYDESVKKAQQDNLDKLYSELDANKHLGKIKQNSNEEMQALLNIQIKLNSAEMQSVNTAENQLKIKEQIYDLQKAMRDADKSKVETSIDLTVKMLKQQNDNEKKRHEDKINHLKKESDEEQKNLDAELDAIKEKIRLQKEALQQEKDAHDHAGSLADKSKSVSDLKSQIGIIDADNSDSGQKKKLVLQQQLSEKQKDLDNFNYDYSISQQQDALDKTLEKYENEYSTKKDLLDQQIKDREDAIQKEIDIIEKASNDEVNLRKTAMNLINGKSQQFYNDLIDYNRQYGTAIDEDIMNKWNDCYTSLSNYNNGQLDVLSTLRQLTFQMKEYSDISNSISNLPQSKHSLTPNATKANVVSSQKSNSSQETATSSSSTYIAKKGDTLSGIAKSNGISLSKLEAENSNIKNFNRIAIGQKIKIPKYQNGGVDIVGGEAILHGTPSRPEVIFNASDASKLFDFVHNSPDITSKILSQIMPKLASVNLPQINNRNTSNPIVNVPITIQGNADTNTIRQLNKIQDNIVDKVFSKMSSNALSSGATKTIYNK